MNEKSKLDKSGYVQRARFRHQLRLFERFTEEACVKHGITLAQYLLLIQVKGRPERDWALVGELAESMVLRHHTAVELVGRCEAAGLVRREQDEDDRRRVRVLLTSRGERTLERIAREHAQELELLLRHMRAAVDPAGESIR